MAEEKFEEMSLIGHLTELRKRLLWSFLYILLIFIVCFYFADELFAFLASPLVELFDNCLLYTSPSPRDLSTARMPSSA